MKNKLPDFDKIAKEFDNLSDEAISRLKFAAPWQYSPTATSDVTVDGAPLHRGTDEEGLPITREGLQSECWKKFNLNPQVNTSVRGGVGRIAGWGFETTSLIREIQEAIEETELDHRNRLYNYWPKYIGRSSIEGELFLCLTVHRKGFIEVDFLDPSLLDQGGDDDTGIIFHPNKTNMPLFYNINLGSGDYEQIPSIFIARYPELLAIAKKSEHFKKTLQKDSLSRSKAYKQFKGYYRFIVSWDKGFITRRATSYLKTTIQWLNYYEELKRYEIDHKKALGSYVWVFTIETPKDFRLWLNMTDEQRAATGIAAKKTPGSSLVLPPGVSLKCETAQLPSMSGQDSDIMGMAISGLNEPADVTTGEAKGTFASVKASRGPMSDRISDEIAYFDRFAKYDFWSAVFFLKSVVSDFPTTFKKYEAVNFVPSKTEEGEVKTIFEHVKKLPEQLIDISYPISEVADYEGKAKGLLGVKHGPISDTLGIPAEKIAAEIGFGSYGRNRLRKATEERNFPELIYTMDAEKLQELSEGETPTKPVKSPKKKDVKDAK